MKILSVVFAAFMISLFMILSQSKKESQRQSVLLAASYVFYAYANICFLPVLIFQTVTAYCSAKAFQGKEPCAKKRIFIFSIVLEIGVLAVFKYSEIVFNMLGNTGGGYNKANIILPLGISFYTFQAVSYIVDTYKETISAEDSFKRVALYVGFFPQITSGPIVKAHDFIRQLEEEHPLVMQNIVDGAQIFLMGVVKKKVIADRLGRAVDAVYAAPNVYSGMSILLATIAYSIQIYCDFSGYSDMAAGIARGLGYDLGRNFNLPYIARNPTEFWRRWHISLSGWFKEYVYISLGGSRGGLPRTCCNILIVMLLSGVWHGAGWTFLLWGLYHAIGSVVHKLYTEWVHEKGWHMESVTGKKIGNAVSMVLTFLFVNMGWVLFRAESLESAMTVIGRIFTLAEGVQYIYVYTVVFAILLAVVCVYVAVRMDGEASYILPDYSRFSSWFLLWTVILLTLAFFYKGDTAFIYGGF